MLEWLQSDLTAFRIGSSYDYQLHFVDISESVESMPAFSASDSFTWKDIHAKAVNSAKYFVEPLAFHYI